MTINSQNLFLDKMTKDIYRIIVRFPYGISEVNSYLVHGEQGFTVVDTGSASKESIAIWERVLKSGINVEKVVVTHLHPDHYGLASWFQKQVKVPVCISRIGYKMLRKNKKYGLKLEILFEMHGGITLPEHLLHGEQEAAPFFEPDGLFGDKEYIKLGDDLYTTVWTPGHSYDHFCFYQPKKQLMFLGDHILPNISPIVGIFDKEDMNPLENYFESLEKIKKYPARLSFPGHGEPIRNLLCRVKDIKNRHDYRLEQILDIIKNQEKSAEQVNYEIYGETGKNEYIASFMSTVTKLEYLTKLGKVICMDIDEKKYYIRV